MKKWMRWLTAVCIALSVFFSTLTANASISDGSGDYIADKADEEDVEPPDAVSEEGTEENPDDFSPDTAEDEREELSKEDTPGDIEKDETEKPYSIEEILPGAYRRIGDSRARSAATSSLQVGWLESLGSIDPGLIALEDPYNVSVKFVDSSDGNNPDMNGKYRMIYCVQYQKNAPEGQINWNGGGKVPPQIAYLLYWGCRYWNQESVWSGYRTGYDWRYDCLATQYAIHIANGEFSSDVLYRHLKGPKKDHFYSIVCKMVEDARNPVYYTPFQNGWKNITHSLSDATVTWVPEQHEGREGYGTKWITQNLYDGQVNCREYITSSNVSADQGAVVLWKNQGSASDFRFWIPKEKYLAMQESGSSVTAILRGTHADHLTGWTYESVNPGKYQMVTLLEGGGAASHEQRITIPVPKKNIQCFIHIQKADKDTGSLYPQGSGSFSGAIYEVKNREGKVVDKITTDSEGKGKSAALPTGIYEVREKQAPFGYNLDPSVYTITFQNSNIDQSVYEQKVQSAEPIQKGSVRLKKISSSSGRNLGGAGFKLFNKDNMMLGEYFTDKNGMLEVKNLIFDQYYFRESKAPDGYERSDDKISFAITKEAQEKCVEVEAQNAMKEAEIILYKQIEEEELNFANGVPVFFFEVSGTDVDGIPHQYHKEVAFTPEYVEKNKREDGSVRISAAFGQLKAGTYEARELGVMRYSLKSMLEVNGGVQAGEHVVFDLVQNQKGSAVFLNGKDEWSGWSDTALCVNVVPGKGGKSD